MTEAEKPMAQATGQAPARSEGVKKLNFSRHPGENRDPVNC